MSNNSIFKNHSTLESLKTNITSLPSERMCLYNRKDAFVAVEAYLNILITEYNKKIKQDKIDYNECLFKAFGYLFPFLSHHGKIFALSNRCILTDDDSQQEFHDYHFVKSLNEANKYYNFSEIEFNLPCANIYSYARMYYTLGFLNFRAQMYKEAEAYLLACTAYLENHLDDYEKRETYVSCIICLANCYEYTNRPEEALKYLLGVEADALNKHLISKQNFLIRRIVELYNADDITKNNVHEICNLLVPQIPKTFAVFEFFVDEENVKNEKRYLIEFIHILAHSLSEHAAQKIYQTESGIYPVVSLLQITSRFLMDWVTRQDEAFITCQATVRAENDACREALNLLMHFYKRKYQCPDKVVTDERKAKEKAELEFYIFYFAEQELRYNYQDKLLENDYIAIGKRFLKYAQDTNNKDSQFYYHVIYFKFLLKKNAEAALLYDGKIDFTEVDKAYINLIEARNEELRHVFKWLIEESNRLEQLYILFRQFRYLNNDNVHIDDVNMQEYLRLLVSSGIKIPEECEAKLEEQYKEIAVRNKILILAPVQTAPSCAFSVRNIDMLLLMPSDFASLPVPSYLHATFVAIDEDRESKKIKVLRMVNPTDDSKLAKWAFVYRLNDSHFFMYYGNEVEQGRSTFPAVLVTPNEINRLKILIEKLMNVLRQERVDPFNCCNRSLNHSGNCYTRVIKYGNNSKVDAALLDLLVFFEFDFYSLDNENRLQNGDCILISCKRQAGHDDYKIVAFSSDISSLKNKDVCHFVDMINIDETTEREPSPEEKPNRSVVCIHVDLKSAGRQLATKKITVNDESSDEFTDIITAEEIIYYCKTNGTCRDNSKRTNRSCELMEFLLRCNITDCLLEGFE